jgi:hypothetical protein
MNFADDERARVPFALVGVVLLVTSATAAAALAAHDPAPDRTRGDRAADRVETGADVALASATRTALSAAARDPVVVTAGTRYGAAIDPENAFRESLSLRVYARTERALRTVDATAGDVTASVSLPRVQTTGDAERAIDAVAVERVNESVVRVTVTGVGVVLRRDGDVVSRSRTNVSTSVHSSVLALHDRVQRFETMLDRDAFDGPGLDRRVTDLLHRVVWLRGPLQYAGLPVSNVLANRHVELATNRALLSLQDTALGRSDHAGDEAYRRARSRVGLRDVVAAVETDATDRATGVLTRSGAPEGPVKVGLSTATDAARAAGQVVPVGVNVTADRAFVSFVDGESPQTLAGTLRDAYTTTVRRSVDVTRLDTTTTQSGSVPENWTLDATNRESHTRVAGRVEGGDGRATSGRTISTHGRRVVVTERTTRRYVDGNDEQTVVETRRETYRVTVVLEYEVTPPPRTPYSERAESILDASASGVSERVHDRIAACATDVLLADTSVESLARRAIDEDIHTQERHVHPRVPRSVRERAYGAVARLRERARNVTENVSTHALANGRVPVDSLRSRVVGLNDAAPSYDSLSDRAVAAASEAYLARVDARLMERRADGALSDVGEQLGDRGLESPPDARATDADAGPVAAVDGAPTYLTLAEVTPAMAPDVEHAFHPLAARNVNWFTVPHGDAAQAVLSRALPDPPETARLGTAGQALHSANRTLASASNRTLRQRRDALQSAVEEGVSSAALAYRGVLAASNLAFTEAERRRATRSALARWGSLDTRARAIANGSAARAVATEAARIADADGVKRDRLAALLRSEAPKIAQRGAVRVESGLVSDAVQSTRHVGRLVAENALSEAGAATAERVARRLGAADVGAVPAGLPLAPVPGFWYATANAWSVSIRGEWARFAVHAAGGSPTGPGNGTAYVRESEPVAFDVNGDGRPDRVGRNERLAFEVEATVGVVVPAGPRGVGDVGGDADEQSAGW